MAKFLLGKKIGMTQVLSEDKNGYNAVQVGFGVKKLNKPEAGHQKKDVSKKEKGFSFLREFSPDSDKAPQLGEKIDVSQFEIGERVSVKGVTKGKGFQGVVKRWGFK